jgi:hypothetical protein
MGRTWTAKLNVEFEMMEDRLQPEPLARVVLMREVAQYRLNIERGLGVGPTGVLRNTARVKIVSQRPAYNLDETLMPRCYELAQLNARDDYHTKQSDADDVRCRLFPAEHAERMSGPAPAAFGRHVEALAPSANRRGS